VGTVSVVLFNQVSCLLQGAVSHTDTHTRTSSGLKIKTNGLFYEYGSQCFHSYLAGQGEALVGFTTQNTVETRHTLGPF